MQTLKGHVSETGNFGTYQALNSYPQCFASWDKGLLSICVDAHDLDTDLGRRRKHLILFSTNHTEIQLLVIFF